MSLIKVGAIRGVAASTDAISIASDGSCTANVTNNLSYRNLLINGAHNIWQRTTSISGGSDLDNFAYATDRFWLYSPSSSSGTVGRSTDVPSGFIYSTHNNLNANCTIGSNVELLRVGSDAPFVNGESLTLSFYIKSSVARSNVSIGISTRDNAGGTGSVTRATSPTFNTTTSWTRVSKPFTLTGTIGANNAILQFEVILAPGDLVTGFQLEKGSFATEFEHINFTDSLRQCQRYCFHDGTDRFHYGNYGQEHYDFPVTMRTNPTVTLINVPSGGSVNRARPNWVTITGMGSNNGNIKVKAEAEF